MVRTVALATGRRMYQVYILQSRKNGRYYTGSTNNLKRRLAEHNSGRSEYTKPTKPFDLVYSEVFETRTQAVQRERYFKTGKGREELKNIISNLHQTN
ncbi:MAG: GIY-YIG nuclease family protein [Patescibacteria group bacterium]